MTWPRSMLLQFSSNQRFASPARRSFRVTILSNNIGEKNMEQTMKTKRYGGRLEQDCGGGRGRWREIRKGVEC